MRILALVLILLTISGYSQDLIGEMPSGQLKGNSKKLLKQGARYFKSEKGKIEFVLPNGTSTLRYDRYGLRVVQIDEIKEDGLLKVGRYMFLRDGDLNLFIDLSDTTAQYTETPNWSMGVDERIDQEMQAMNLAKDGSEEILGQICVKWAGETKNGELLTYLVWRGIALISSGVLNKKAISLELDYKLSERAFDILKSVKIKTPSTY